MADEKPICGKALDRSHGASKFIRQRTNHRDLGKVALELERHRKDQAGLNLPLEWAEKIGERQAGNGVGEWCHRGLHSVSREIHPFQK